MFNYDYLPRIAVEARLLDELGVVSRSLMDKLIHVKRVVAVLRKGGGARGASLLVDFDTLPADKRNRLAEFGYEPNRNENGSRLLSLLEPDVMAYQFFADYVTKLGKRLPADVQTQYCTDAMILKAVKRIIDGNGRAHALARRSRGVSLQQAIVDAVAELPEREYPHGLKCRNKQVFFRTYKAYCDEGYEALIHGNFSNRNAAKVDEYVEQVLLALYCMDELPFAERVHEMYLQFLAGTLDVFDTRPEFSGLLFERDRCRNAQGELLTLSAATVWNVVTKPSNAVIVASFRKNQIDFNTLSKPHMQRKRPDYSMSKVSFDDRALSRKTSDGKWLTAYVAVDVHSECFISCVCGVGSANMDMIWSCFRELYRFCVDNNVIWPLQGEFENHLISDIDEEIKDMFAHVRFCAPVNSKEKRAEHAIRSLKYGTEKKKHVGVGRWYGATDAYRIKSKHKDPELKEQRIPEADLIADVYADIEDHNHKPHSIFKNKTRWQVLMENQNPNGIAPQAHRLMQHIGYEAKKGGVLLQRNDYIRCQYANYQIDSLHILSQLQSNNYTVDARYLPATDGTIPTVWLYQNGRYLGAAHKVERYNEAMAERTDDDKRILADQQKRLREFETMVKDGRKRVAKAQVVAVRNEPLPVAEVVSQPVPEPVPVHSAFDVDAMDTDWAIDRAFDSF